MFNYLSPDNAAFMRGILFFAVVGIIRIVELIIKKDFFGLQNLMWFALLFTALNVFRH